MNPYRAVLIVFLYGLVCAVGFTFGGRLGGLVFALGAPAIVGVLSLLFWLATKAEEWDETYK